MDLGLPIFDRNHGHVMRSEAALRQAEHFEDAKVLEIEAEVLQAVRSYEAAYAIVTTMDEPAVLAAQSAHKRIETAYALGGRTLLEVLDAQAAYREILREHARARANLFRTLHQLNATVGTEILR